MPILSDALWHYKICHILSSGIVNDMRVIIGNRFSPDLLDYFGNKYSLH